MKLKELDNIVNLGCHLGIYDVEDLDTEMWPLPFIAELARRIKSLEKRLGEVNTDYESL